MTTNLLCLVYSSRNTIVEEGEEPSAAIASILAVSRENKSRDGVTGAMFYSDGWFAQVLEGESEAVHRTFERIQRDPRHGDVVVLEVAQIETRMFGDWDMALATEFAEHPSGLGTLLAGPDVKGPEILALLIDLVQREEQWAHAAD